jgi:hypothetical protein
MVSIIVRTIHIEIVEGNLTVVPLRVQASSTLVIYVTGTTNLLPKRKKRTIFLYV